MTTQDEASSGSEEIRRLMQDEVIARIPLLLKYTSSAGLRLQVPETDIQIIAGPHDWIVSQSLDAATDSSAQRVGNTLAKQFGYPEILPESDLASQSQAAQPSINTPELRRFMKERIGLDTTGPTYKALLSLLAGQSQATRAVPEGWNEALEAIANHGLDARQCMELAQRALAAPIAQEVTKQAVPDLHNAIMNLPCSVPKAFVLDTQSRVAFKEGHRDARHAAAELVNEAEAAQEVTQQAAKAETAEQANALPRAGDLVAQPKLYSRLMEMSDIIRADARWTGNEVAFADKSESDVAMLDDILGDALRLAAEPPVAQTRTAGAAKGGITSKENSPDLAPTTSTVSAPEEVRLAAYDPNIRWARQRVRLTLKQWDYTATLETTVCGNCQGFEIFDSAISNAWESLPTRGEDMAYVTLTRTNGDELECEDDELNYEDWLKQLVVGIEIVGQEPERTTSGKGEAA